MTLTLPIQDEFEALLNICIVDEDRETYRDYFRSIVNEDKCEKINFIYHGQTSLCGG